VKPGSNKVILRENNRFKLARIIWIALAALAVAVFLTSLPGYLRQADEHLHLIGNRQPPAGILFLLVGSGLASIAAALMSMGLAFLLFRHPWNELMIPFLAFYLLAYSVVMAGPLEMWSLAWLGQTNIAILAQGILMTVPTMALLALFPNGRFTPSWTRWAVLASVPVALLTLVTPFNPNLTEQPVWGIPLLIVAALLTVLGIYAQVYRYRHTATATERQQTKWAVFGLGLWLSYVMISTGPYLYLESLPPGAPWPWWAPLSVMGWWLSLNILPVTLAVSVLRYRLWDIDVFINRTLVYGALTACVIAIYVLLVAAMGLLFQTQADWLVALIATIIVAILFQPLRERLQRSVNRLIYGERDEPFEVLARLGQRLEVSLSSEAALATIVETIAQTLKLPYVALAPSQQEESETGVAYGRPTPQVIAFPLLYNKETVGQLLVAPRASGESFSEAETRLLRTIARQAGTALHNVQLTADLQRSRRRLVTAREEERRRLRRDLHDGLGPTLAAHLLKIGSARELLDRDSKITAQLLTQLEDGLEGTLEEIRRLVYDLRPPALDQLGLVGAVQACAAEYERPSSNSQKGLTVTVTAPDTLPPLPAAVEVAAYRIAQEALHNVFRHAQASQCAVTLRPQNNALWLEVQDNGRGLPPNGRAGVGLQSMKERAAELNGRCVVESLPTGGTRVTAELPLS
jgi:signal transduction histidine kinase